MQPSLVRPKSAASLDFVRKKVQHANWPLILGISIVFLVVLLAWLGPRLAPMDPMEQHYTLEVNGRVRSPPYPPFTIPGFPLGTDNFGRDLFSRLLWAIRPTLMMIVIVAAVRLGLGILLGLVTGWSNGRVGRFLDSLLSLALAIPLLIVALIGIAAVGVDKGLIAFIVGLALTGWAETARLVSEQTRAIRHLAFVEAAQALGASDTRILFFHVLRQIMPMIWMLLAFEVSATLLVAAELGFLGYFIGGGIWIEVYDYQSVNTAGLPELGEMLSSSLVKLTDPSALLAVGSVLFAAILGFILLGEGLRQELTQARMVGRVHTTSLGAWIEEHVAQPLFDWAEDHSIQIALTAVVILSVGAAMIWMGSRPQIQPAVAVAPIPVPGGHPWAAVHHDAQGTSWTNTTGPRDPDLLWEYYTEYGFNSGPVVHADGSVILATPLGHLISFYPEGVPNLDVIIDDVPVGTPALGLNGEIYVAGENGSLNALGPDGSRLWQFVSPLNRPATSGPVVGPDGTIYYTLVDYVQAVTPQGEHLWNTYASDSYLEIPPRLSPGGGILFLKDTALAAQSGVPIDLRGLPVDESQFTDPTFVVGADSTLYYRRGHELIGWRSTQDGIITDPPIAFGASGRTAFFPHDAGATPNGLVWFFYRSDFSDTLVAWMDKQSLVVGSTRLPERQTRLIGIDRESVMYFCSPKMLPGFTCKALKAGQEEPLWEVDQDGTMGPSGGALVEGRLYVTTIDGHLYAFGDRP